MGKSSKRHACAAALSVSALIVSGCSTSPAFYSYPANFRQAADKDHYYVGEYALPRSKIKVTVKAQGAGGAAAADPPPGVSFTSTITVNGEAKPAAGDGPAAPPAKAVNQASVCADIRKTYAEDRVQGPVYYKKLSEVSELVQIWVAGPTLEGEALERAVGKLVELRTAKIRSDTARKRTAWVAKIINDCPEPITVELTEIVEESSQKYFLYATSAAMSNDDLKVEYAGTFLKSVTATTEDRTADVVVEASKTLGFIVGAVSAPAGAIAGAVADAETKAAKPLKTRSGKSVPQNLEDQISAVIEADLKKEELLILLEQINAIIADGAPGFLPDINSPLPFSRILVPDLTAAKIRDDEGTELAGMGTYFKVMNETLNLVMKIDCPDTYAVDKQGDTEVRIPNMVGNLLVKTATANHQAGIVVPRQGSCIASVRRDGSEGRDLGRIQFVATDPGSASIAQVSRVGMVRTTSTYSFDKGRVATAHVVRPSTVASGASLPFRAIGGVLDGIIGGIGADTKRAEAEALRLNTEIDRIKKAQALKDLKEGKTGEDGE